MSNHVAPNLDLPRFVPQVPSLDEYFDLSKLLGDNVAINDALPGLRLHEPTALLIDNNNLFKVAAKQGFKIDYRKLKQIFEQRCDLRYAALFTAVDRSDPKSPAWCRSMEHAGWTLETKNLYWFTNEEGVLTSKGNMDVALAIKAMKLSESLSHVIIATCDGDYLELIDELKETKFRRVSVLGIAGRNWQGMSRQLAKAADNFYDMMRIKDYVSYESDTDV